MTRLYGHSQDLARALPLIRRIRPEYWKAIDPDPESARKCAEMDVKLIVRHYGPWDNGEPEKVIPPDHFVTECVRQPWWPYAWAVETPNEPHPGKVGWLTDAVMYMEGAGKECVVGNWGTGWDGFYVPGARLYSGHEYWWDSLEDQFMYHLLRHQDLGQAPGHGGWFEREVLPRNPQAKLLITEFGVTHAVEGGPDVGWTTGDEDPTYLSGIQWYLSQLKPYVEGVFLYQVGGNPDWKTFEVLGTPIEEWFIQHHLQTNENTNVSQVEKEVTVPEFRLGFKAEADRLWYQVVGDPISDETYIGDGFSYQFTSKGIMFYDKSSNTVHFVRAEGKE